MTAATPEVDEVFVQLIASLKLVADRYANPVPLGDARRGHFSLVFTADDTRTAEKVILKFLSPKADRYREQCFYREADICKCLVGRENIVQLRGEIDVLTVEVTFPGLTQPLPYLIKFFALERASQDFAAFLLSRRRAPSLRRRLEVIRDVVKGVNRLHNANYCHRDLKPDNILLSPGGVGNVGDLGTCRSLLEDDPALADYPHPVGHIWYTAPELICGGWNDRRLYKGADWFSVGAILFESLAGVNLYVAVGLRDDNLIDMVQTFGALPGPVRLATFEQHVSDISGRYPIPSVHEYAKEPWLAAASGPTLVSLDRVVQYMCHFDHRRRWPSFGTILTNIDICLSRARADEAARARRFLRGLVSR